MQENICNWKTDVKQIYPQFPPPHPFFCPGLLPVREAIIKKNYFTNFTGFTCCTSFKRFTRKYLQGLLIYRKF